MTEERQHRSHLSTRAKARKRAVDILFESDLRDVELLETLSARTADADPPVRDYTTYLVTGVVQHLLAIDQRISECLVQDWTLERMPRVDRAIARIAVFEIDHTDLPQAVAIAEATQLATELSTDDSPAFLNGVLGKVADTVGQNL
ncbi:MAG: transcription antitermination factor NusB [Propionibacteriaceae bacterium]